MKRISSELEEIRRDALILIPCCAKKLPGGAVWPANSDLLWELMPKQSRDKILSSRRGLVKLINANSRYITNKYAKNIELCVGKDFGRTDTAGRYLPAIERYIGNLYTAHGEVVSAIRECTNINGGPRLLILSALYGPLHPLSPIQDYNLRMSDAPAKRAWMSSFAQFLELYVESNAIRVVWMYFGTSTAYFDVGRLAVEPLVRRGSLDRAYQYNVIGGNSFHTPHNHGLLLLSALRKNRDLEFTKEIEVKEI